MPNYRYRCPECSEEFSERYSFEDDSSKSPCPACGNDAKKVYEATPAHFLGGGWGGK